jgi:thiol-disulfide isomerase/thioredoxin
VFEKYRANDQTNRKLGQFERSRVNSNIGSEGMSKTEDLKKKEKQNTLVSKIKDKETAYVLFYATWCPYSQRFLPIFEELSKSKPEECLKVIVDEEPDLCEEYGVEYYPTVIMFKKGAVHKRLDPEPHVGLNKKQLNDLTKEGAKKSPK